MSRSIPFWSKTGTTSTTAAVVRLPSNWTELKVYADVLSLAQIGLTYAAPGVTAVNGIITISSAGTPTAGTFKYKVMGGGRVLATTSDLVYNESAANVKTALVATGYFASGDITAAGGALPTAITLTLAGVYAGVVPELALVSSVTPGSITSRTTTAPAGNGGYAYIEATTQEVWSNDNISSRAGFLYIAAVTGTGNYRVSAFR